MCYNLCSPGTELKKHKGHRSHEQQQSNIVVLSFVWAQSHSTHHCMAFGMAIGNTCEKYRKGSVPCNVLLQPITMQTVVIVEQNGRAFWFRDGNIEPLVSKTRK